ncbi:iron-containing redox enzyme family protein [Diaminobutyricimonas aerilata]|nr:iron-containing redox enzyme family protein [Diaminobutyricimonas aerilata]
MRMPRPRGPVSESVFELLVRGTAPADLDEALDAALAGTADIVADDDLQLALFCLYELHYGGIEGVDDALEWNPDALAARARIEVAFERALRERVAVPDRDDRPVADVLFELTGKDGGPSLSRYVARTATLEQVRELLMLRTMYTLKEADPHSWAVPRLSGRSKAALVEIQSDEYGGGRPQRVHSAIFVRTLRAAGLDPAYGAYLDVVPGIILASTNMMSLFGLHRRLRGAIVGHLAAFEMTSSIPSRLVGNGLRRLGFDDDATWYFDEHVEADAVHEQIAARDMAGGLVAAEPRLRDEVVFGAAACLAVDGWGAQHILDAWEAGRSSLRTA